jgi:hypothetical protein
VRTQFQPRSPAAAILQNYSPTKIFHVDKKGQFFFEALGDFPL